MVVAFSETKTSKKSNMELKSTFKSINQFPIHFINAENIQKFEQEINSNVVEADLIGIDLEMTGLVSNNKKNLASNNDVNIRYIEMKEASEEFGIISIGISCFKTEFDNSYSCKVYSLLICRSPTISFNLKSANFLSKHKFNFNELFTDAILYKPAFLDEKLNSSQNETSDHFELNKFISLRKIVTNIFLTNGQICFHNGFIDILFLYSHFFCKLPSQLNTFIQDMTLICGNSLYDTKLIATMCEFKASYLVYVFRKLQRLNEKSEKVNIDFPLKDESIIDCKFSFCGLMQPEANQRICDKFAKFGWCNNDTTCSYSHDIDYILNNDEDVKKIKNHKKSKHDNEEDPYNISQTNKTIKNRPQISKFQIDTHKSGFDSFMCGYSLLIFKKLTNFSKNESDWFGKIALPGFDMPLVFTPSTHFTNSKNFMIFYHNVLPNIGKDVNLS